MSISMKRNLAHLHHNQAHNVTDPAFTAAKRRCLSINQPLPDNYFNVSSDESNSSSDDDDEGDSSSMINRRSVHALQRSLRFVAPVDSELSKAVSQYSDDDEEQPDDDDDVNDSNNNNHNSSNCNSPSSTTTYKRRNNVAYGSSGSDDENDDTDTGANQSYHSDYLNKRSQSSNDILSYNYSATKNCLNKRNSVNVSDILHTKDQDTIESFGNFNMHKTNSLNHNNNVNSSSIPQSDFTARSRCFEYIVGAIDEAWARYCDSTSYDEDVAYEFNEDYQSSNHIAHTPASATYTTDEDDGYKSEFSATTTVTEYDSDFHNKSHQLKGRSFSIMNNQNNIQHNRRVSEVPENMRLQELKDRFTKSKYYLEDLVDSDTYNDCISFWNKWDLIKYSIVDFVEEDEEDDEIERKIDDLERGRFVGSLSVN